MTAKTLSDRLLTRTREPLGTATPPALARILLSYAQQAVNIAHADVLATTTMTTATRQLVYPFGDIASNLVRIESVRLDGEALLPRADWRELAQTDRAWFRRMGSKLRLWAQIGRSFLVLYPGLSAPTTVTLTYTTLTTRLTGESTAVELPDVRVEAVVDFAEALVLARRRLFVSAKPAAERFQQHLAESAL